MTRTQSSDKKRALVTCPEAFEGLALLDKCSAEDDMAALCELLW